LVLDELAGEIITRELRPLISIEYLRTSVVQRSAQRLNAE
jgi:hypothetical protein